MCSHLHPQTHGVEHDEEKHQVLEVTRSDDVPNLVLTRVFRDVASQRSGLQCILDTLALQMCKNTHYNLESCDFIMCEAWYLVFVQLAVFVLLLSLFLEGDNNEAHKDVHHEEGDEDEVNDEEDGNLNAVVVNWANVFQIRVDGFIQQAAHRGAIRKMCSAFSSKATVYCQKYWDTNFLF